MKDRSLLRGVLVSVAFFVAMVAVLVAGLTQVDQRNSAEQTAALKDSVLRATLVCYAVEGRYPADISYLEQHYGITYDHQQYIVRLDSFAQNLLPDIYVLVEGES